MEPAEILKTFDRLKVTARVEGDELRLEYPRSATAKIQALGPQIKRHKLEILRLLGAAAKAKEDRILDGHEVRRVIWETAASVVFQDESGAFWRYLHDYRKAWPVIVESRGEPAEFLGDVLGGRLDANVTPVKQCD